MEIKYLFENGEGNGSLFLRNKDLVAYFPNNTSYYFGLFLLNDTKDPIKLLDSFIDGVPKSVSYGKHHAILSYEKEHKVMLGSKSIQLDFATEQYLDLDFRAIYDFGDEGRFYQIKNSEITIIECKNKDKEYFMAIKGSFEPVQEWIEKNYPYDASRGDKTSLWVYRAGKVKGKVKIGLGINEKEAINSLKETINTEEFKDLQSLVKHNLSTLKGKEQVYAGLPWFFQYWSRDELISIGAYPEIIKKIVIQYCRNVQENGRLPNRVPSADLGSADSIGVLALRASQILNQCSAEEKYEIQKSMKKANEGIKKYYLKNGLVINYDQETWMDTISRKGFNIEIQAGYARILSLLKQLGEDVDLQGFVNQVREEFVNVDNLEDSVIRPNIFLAYYYYPELFEKPEWEKKFKKVINECFLQWGGFSTVSKKSWLYHDTDTGLTDEAYHNGNTWYFVNNIAAIAMLDFPSLKKYANKIFEASKKEMLYHGLLGCNAEIGHAKELSSRGCFHQTWSIATFQELLLKLNSSNSNSNSC